MLQCETFSFLLLAGACLSAWAAPLGSTSSLQSRDCETSEHLGGEQHEEKCKISSTQLPALNSHVQEWQKRGGDRNVGEVAVTDGAKILSRQASLPQKGGKPFEGYQRGSTESTENSTYLSRARTESLTVGFTLEPGNAKEPQKNTEGRKKVWPSTIPSGLRTDRPAETQVVPGHADYVRSGSFLYTNLEEDKKRVKSLPRDLPQEREGGREADTIKKNKSTQLSPTGPPYMVASTAAWTILSPAPTSLTTVTGSDEEAGGSRIGGEESLFAATEPQDKALAPGLLQLDLTFSSRLPELGGTWTEPLHLQGVEEASVLPLSQEVGTEATMSSEDLPLIFEPIDDVTPPSGSALASELSVAMAPATGMLGDAELEQTVSVDTEHVPPDATLQGPSDWPLLWPMSGSENSDAVSSSHMPVNRPFTEADLEPSERRTEGQQNTDVVPLSLSPSSVSATTQLFTDIQPTLSAALKTKSGTEELESEEDGDDEDVEESEEEDSEEDLNETTIHTTTRPTYRLIPPPPVWGQHNQGLVRSWVELIREKAGYVSGMLVPVGIGIAGALLIVGVLYSVRLIHRKRKNSFKHQRRKQPKEVRSGPDQAMLLADSSEDEL
ncbi:armadillo-like helical domain-containing protein 4 [Hoplias malabaricus]|uniref:armadillo-like helical domain-containing protein 4 n=1 Tax=Hoplias malabaricus TaxID=27720 RepID=UPI0034621A27